MRTAILFALLMLSMSSNGKTLDVEGRVIDEKGEPLPYVNVVLLSLPDSTFIQGAMTDEQGMFHVVTDKNEGLLKITSVGYETQYIHLQPPMETAGTTLTIQLREDSKLLSEVVVKGQLPKTLEDSFARGRT